MAAFDLLSHAQEYESKLGWTIFSFNLRYKLNEKKQIWKKELRLPNAWSSIVNTTPITQRVYAKHNAIGVLTGERSMIFLVDIDNNDQWQSFLKDIGQEEPLTPAELTGSGGKHLYFRYTDDVKDIMSSSKMIKHNNQFLDIDVRSNGGMVIMAPTSNIADGRSFAYQWVDGKSPFQIPLIPLPPWLLAKFKENTAGRTQKTTVATKSTPTTTGTATAEPSLGKQTFTIPEALSDFILEHYNIIPDKLDKLVYFPDSNTFNIQTTEKICVFAKRSHNSNHQYFVIKSKDDGATIVRKCHSKDESCREKEHRSIKLPDDVFAIVENLIPKKITANPIPDQLLELAKNDAKQHVNGVIEGNRDMEMDFKNNEFRGILTTYFNGNSKCKMCLLGKMQSITTPEGTYFQCTNCDHRWPDDDQFISVNKKKYNYLEKCFQVIVINQTINLYNTPENDLSWNEFSDDRFEVNVSEDPVLNQIILEALSGTHQRIAELYYAVHGKTLVNCRDLKNPWFIFQSHRWKNEDDKGIQQILRKSEVLSLIVKAKHCYMTSNVQNKDKKVAQIQRVIATLENNTYQSSVLEQLAISCRKPHYDFYDLLDTQKHLLGFTNGVYDLNTGVFRDGLPEDYVTMNVGYSYDPEKMNDETTTYEFYEFFTQVFPDRDVARYVTKFLGSCLAGYTQDQIFTFGFGTGSNGKGILINIMANVLGGFSAKIDAAFLCGSMPDADKPTPTLTRIVGKRFVYISEVVDSAKLNEQLFKALCGEERMPYRPMYGEQKEFMPDFKMFMVCNSLPSFNGSDYAMKRRIRVIPFESSFEDPADNPNPDPAENKFRKDATLNSRIEGWRWVVMKFLMDGYALYKQEGLTPIPEKMIKLTQSYVSENDIYDLFVSECVIFGSGSDIDYLTLIGDVYNAFKIWAAENNFAIPSKVGDMRTKITDKLAPLAIKRSTSNVKFGNKGVTIFDGMKLTPEIEAKLKKKPVFPAF